MDRRKTAIVTGGSRGIGRAICVKLAKNGMDIVFSFCSGEKQAQETAELCRAQGAKVKAVQADVSDSAQCAKLVAEALEFSDGHVDVLVNNAGITKDNLCVRMTDEEFNDVVEVNLKGSFYMMRAVSKQMLKQRSGKIVNVSSVVGVLGNVGQINYAASKSGVIGMTKTLARELAARKITVNAVAPGFIETDMTAVLSEQVKESTLASVPFHEMGTAEDVANAVAFLTGEESGYITGQVICVDGGMAI